MPDENSNPVWTTQISQDNQSVMDQSWDDFVFDFGDGNSSNQIENSEVEMEGLQEEKWEEINDSLHIDFGDENVVWEENSDNDQDISFEMQDDEIDEVNNEENLEEKDTFVDESSNENAVSLDSEWEEIQVEDCGINWEGKKYMEKDNKKENYQEDLNLSDENQGSEDFVDDIEDDEVDAENNASEENFDIEDDIKMSDDEIVENDISGAENGYQGDGNYMDDDVYEKWENFSSEKIDENLNLMDESARKQIGNFQNEEKSSENNLNSNDENASENEVNLSNSALMTESIENSDDMEERNKGTEDLDFLMDIEAWNEMFGKSEKDGVSDEIVQTTPVEGSLDVSEPLSIDDLNVDDSNMENQNIETQQETVQESFDSVPQMEETVNLNVDDSNVENQNVETQQETVQQDFDSVPQMEETVTLNIDDSNMENQNVESQQETVQQSFDTVPQMEEAVNLNIDDSNEGNQNIKSQQETVQEDFDTAPQMEEAVNLNVNDININVENQALESQQENIQQNSNAGVQVENSVKIDNSVVDTMQQGLAIDVKQWSENNNSSSTLSLDQILDSELDNKLDNVDNSNVNSSNVPSWLSIFSNRKVVWIVAWVGIFLLAGLCILLAFPSGWNDRKPGSTVDTWDVVLTGDHYSPDDQPGLDVQPDDYTWNYGGTAWRVINPEDWENQQWQWWEGQQWWDTWQWGDEQPEDPNLWWEEEKRAQPYQKCQGIDCPEEEEEQSEPKETLDIEEVEEIIEQYKSQAQRYYAKWEETNDKQLIKYAVQTIHACDVYQQQIENGEWLDEESLKSFKSNMKSLMERMRDYLNWDVEEETIVKSNYNDENNVPWYESAKDYVYGKANWTIR